MNTMRLVRAALLGSVMLAPLAVRAADITVTCTDSACEAVPSAGALFQESNMAPGQGVTRSIEIVNNRNEACHAVVRASNTRQDPAGFAGVLDTSIATGADELYQNNLAGLFAEDAIHLGEIGAGGATRYDWMVVLQSGAGNEYQGAKAEFDFDLHVTCALAPSPAGQVAGITTDTSDKGDTKVPRVLGLSTLADTGSRYRWPLYIVLAVSILGAAYSLDSRQKRRAT